jgi:DNA-binding transcriptional MerR regulator
MAIPLTLTSAELVAAVGKLEGKPLPIRTLAKWAAMGVLTPSVQWTGQRRSPRIYVLRDLAKARLILRLRAAGISMPKVRVILAELAAREDLRELLRPHSRAVLEVNGWRTTLHRDGQVAREVPSGQLLLPLIDVVRGNEDAAREVRRAVA